MHIIELLTPAYEAAWLPWAVQYFFLVGICTGAALTAAACAFGRVGSAGARLLPAAVVVLAAQAKKTGTEIELFTRVGEYEGRYYYDLKNRRALSMGPEGWEIDRDPPVFSRNFATQQPHPDPVTGGDPWRFFEHVNVAEENRLLLTQTEERLFSAVPVRLETERNRLNGLQQRLLAVNRA